MNKVAFPIDVFIVPVFATILAVLFIGGIINIRSQKEGASARESIVIILTRDGNLYQNDTHIQDSKIDSIVKGNDVLINWENGVDADILKSTIDKLYENGAKNVYLGSGKKN